MKDSYFLKKRRIVAIAGLIVSGCASTYTNIAPTPPEEYQIIGSATGSSTGSLGILSTAYNFVPMGLNSRIDKAYQDALSKHPEATGLIDVTYQEDWYWWFIGTARTVTIQGTAIKAIMK